MSVSVFRLWRQSQCTIPSLHSHQGTLVLSGRSRRKYATHPSMDFGQRSKLLSESMEKRPEPKHDHVGPFQLGLSPSALGKGEKVRKWSELSTGGKVMRTTARTTNLGVILLGAGLSALLVYSLTSELFSKNSPTVVYGDACDRIKASKRITKYLNGPLTFHNQPPSLVRPRHRNRHVTSRVMVDSYGQEHMIMTFYIHGRPEGETATPSEGSYFDAVKEGLSGISFDEVVEWSKQSSKNLWDKTVRAFRYLSGTPLPPPSLPPLLPLETPEGSTKEESRTWSFAGMFSSLKTTRRPGTENLSLASGRHHTEGEVHADLVKNKDGYFEFHYLLVDIPNSRDPDRVRIFVEREPGVRDNEPVMRWIS